MDCTEQNLENIRLIHFHNMDVKEMVDAGSTIGSQFHRSQGLWWRKVKPFFYQPLPFLKPVIPHQAEPNLLKALGGYYHRVPAGALSNGTITVNEIKDPPNYDLEMLKIKVRNEVRKGLKTVVIRQINNLDDLTDDGCQVYMSWKGRTKDVLGGGFDEQNFRRWITQIFQHPHVLILGAYFENKLIAFVLAYAVDGIAELSKTFSHSSFQNLKPVSALNYCYIKICQNNPEIVKICNGLRSHKPSLEEYKFKLGFQHISYPAYIYLRPLIRPMVRLLFPIQYKRLMGQYSD